MVSIDREKTDRTQTVYAEISELIQSGYALTSDDIGDILEKNGSPETVQTVMGRLRKNEHFFVSQTAVGRTTYRGHTIYFNALLHSEEVSPGIESAQRAIDAKWEEFGKERERVFKTRRSQIY